MTTATKSKTSRLIGAYLVNGTMGNVGMPGAPIMHFSLVVVPSTNSVSGTVEITQALAPPMGDIVIRNVSGVIRATGFGNVTKIVALEGQYVQSVPPPAIGSFLADFSAHMAIDNNWNGKGGFSYGGHDVEDVPVSKS
ncbi:DUF1842 domain-containing protein [Flavobacterium sp. DGU11]|uniref:DUF1842 domain-containing protein n=1 Tax=Flavobacterium arundinis TaxID=3139143 RepID=A0ABU9HS30_9FLAO